MKDLSQVNIKDLENYKNGVTVFIIIIISIFFLNNAYNNYKEGLEERAEKKRLLREAEANLGVWDNLNREYDKLAGGFFGQDFLIFRRYVEEKARRSAVNIDSLKTSQEREDFYQVATLELSVISPYENLVNFIAELEERNVLIEDVSIRKRREGDVETRLVLKTLLVDK